MSCSRLSKQNAVISVLISFDASFAMDLRLAYWAWSISGWISRRFTRNYSAMTVVLSGSIVN